MLFEGVSHPCFLPLPNSFQYYILLHSFNDDFDMTGALQRSSELPTSKAFVGTLNQTQRTTMEANCCILLIRRGKLDEAEELVKADRFTSVHRPIPFSNHVPLFYSWTVGRSQMNVAPYCAGQPFMLPLLGEESGTCFIFLIWDRTPCPPFA